MHYYIDGYNLLFRILKAGDEIRKQREELICDLEKKVNLLELDVTLVFDSHYQKDDNTRSHFKSLTIIYTATGETADEYILQELKESHAPTKHTVITSDKRLAKLCKLRLAATQSVDEFLAWLNQRYKNKLRQQKQGNLVQALPARPVVQTIPKPIPHPTSLDKPQDCFAYYLESFQKEFQKIEESSAPPAKPQQEPKKPKIKKRPLTKEEEDLSDLKRWQKAFERHITDDYFQ